jgi:MerR family transcriptional regulator, thiopeptide resistance regulator
MGKKMAYTVKTLAQLSGVSIRTLHYYDEIGLLKPAFTTESGYRYYQEEQLLMLQQILFFKELGFSLTHIQQVIGRDDFNKSIALRSHKKVLHDKIKRLQELIGTIDETLHNLEGKHTMKQNEMLFKGFEVESEQQRTYEQYLETYFNNFSEKERLDVKAHIKQSKEQVKNWSPQDWEKSHKEFDAICTELANLMRKECSPDSHEVQALIRRHFNWLHAFWTPTKESYRGHGEFIHNSELKDAYNKYHPRLSECMREGIIIFANNEL